jgi:F0F1-type ATP synthase membrane subunit b/b'
MSATGEPGQAEAAREQAAAALAKAQNVPIEQAREPVAQYEQQYRQTGDQAKQKARCGC